MDNGGEKIIKETRSFLVPRNPSIDRRYRPKPVNKIQLFNLISEESDDENSSSPCGISSGSLIQTEGALVYLRMRPTNVDDDKTECYRISENILITSTETDTSTTEKHFSFTDIFHSLISQTQIYESCIRSKIESSDSLTVLTYGTSGSGKTFTLLGDLDNPGIVPRAIENIFTMYDSNISPNPVFKVKNGEIAIETDENAKETMLIRKSLFGNCKDVKLIHDIVKRKISNDHEFQFIKEDNCAVYIWISFVEIYNEQVFDLLRPDDNVVPNTFKTGLRVISNAGKVFIKNLTSIYATNSLEAYKLLTIGLKRVTYASTAINNNSSRSHCIFFVDVIKFQKPDLATQLSYKFSDLAGSERVAKTKNIGNRLKEAQKINTSLMVLGRCLEAANNNQNKKNPDVVPIRESKLTMLLQAALLGHEKIVMIVNITPTRHFYEENMNVLSFASIAQNIVYKIPKQKPKKSRFSWLTDTVFTQNLVTDGGNDDLIQENISLQNEVERLLEMNQRLEDELIEQKLEFEKELDQQEISLRRELVNTFEIDIKRRNERWEEEVLRKEKAMRRLEDRYKTMKSFYESKLADLEEEESEVIELDATVSEPTTDQLDNCPKKRRLDHSY